MEDLYDVRHHQHRRYGYLLCVRLSFGVKSISIVNPPCRIIPETKGRSLEDMDIIFGSITAEEREANIRKAQNDQGVEQRSDSDKEGSVTKREIV